MRSFDILDRGDSRHLHWFNRAKERIIKSCRSTFLPQEGLIMECRVLIVDDDCYTAPVNHRATHTARGIHHLPGRDSLCGARFRDTALLPRNISRCGSARHGWARALPALAPEQSARTNSDAHRRRHRVPEETDMQPRQCARLEELGSRLERYSMRDVKSDWKRWSRAER